MFEIRTYQTADGSRPYDEWLDGISPAFAARIRKGVSRMEAGNFGDSWRLNSDVPIFERRFDFGPGFRAYYGRDGEAVVLLLCGGDKSSQRRDIAKAAEYWKDYMARKDNVQ